MSKPRAYTRDELQSQFLAHIHGLVDYWLHDSRTPEVRGKLDGLALSILTLLDGEAANMPSFIVSPSPHKADRSYYKQRGESWYPNGCDIGGNLHKQYMRKPSLPSAGDDDAPEERVGS